MVEGIFIIVILTAISGVLSSLEIALSSLNKNKVKVEAENGSKAAKRLFRSMENPGKFFATTQLYITFIAYFSGAFVADLFTSPLMGIIQQIEHFSIPENILEPVVFLLITAAFTYVALVFGELVPKRIAMQHSYAFAQKAIGFLDFLSFIGRPFVKALSISSSLVLRLMGFKGGAVINPVTREDIRLMVEAGGEHGHIAETEQDMIENIFEFDKLTAEDVCTHRIDVVALPIDSTFDEITEVFIKEQFSRLVIFEDNLDNVVGILHLKDIVPYLAQKTQEPFDLRSLLREPYFVLSSKRVDKLLVEMRKKMICMAVIIDEYGGTAGIVSTDDLVNQVMGNIKDEYDEREIPEIQKIDENNYRILGSAQLEKISENLGLFFPMGEIETLSGFLIEQLGHIPSENEKPTNIRYGDFTFTTERVQEKKISSVLACRKVEMPSND